MCTREQNILRKIEKLGAFYMYICVTGNHASYKGDLKLIF